MSKRLLIVLLLAFTPLAVLADDTPPPDATPVATDTPAPTDTPSPSIQPDSAAAGLGPASTGSSNASTGDGSALQPAGGSPLQSTTQDATGLSAPNANALQAPTTPGDTLRVLAGEADGGPHTLDDSDTSSWAWLWWLLLIGAVIAVAGWVFRGTRIATPAVRRLRRLWSHLRLP